MIIGKIHEELYFGKCPWQSNEHEEWFECFKRIIRIGHQEGTLFTESFYKEIAWRLGYSNNNNIEFFSAIGSPLDLFHGIDGFVVVWLDEKKCNAKIVTLDITLKGEKDVLKSDFLITPPALNNTTLLIESIVLFLKTSERILYSYY
ncbi:hypothetical protein L6261_04440 [Candidatus Parcubacteria bacterium]|nr:hypothetical protein [Candidatus Parcubacteria bacterium]